MNNFLFLTLNDIQYSSPPYPWPADLPLLFLIFLLLDKPDRFGLVFAQSLSLQCRQQMTHSL